MRKWLVILGGAVVVLGLGGLAWAGDYHSGDTLLCYQCHTMHYSQQHQYDGTAGAGTPSLSGGPNSYLLRQPGSSVCLACHDQVADIPDVSGADLNSTSDGGRQAGALPTAANPYEAWKGHSLTTGAVTPPGGSAMTSFGCKDCHTVHGNSNYRNLATTVTYTVSTSASNSQAVRVNLASVPAVGSRISGKFYSRDYTFFNEPSNTDSQYGDFCAFCHGSFHGTANTGSATAFTRHPTEAVDFSGGVQGQYSGKTNKVQVLLASNSGSITDWTGATPSCMSCHKAHGNQNPFGLIYMAGTGGRTEQGTSGGVLRDLCGQCHSYGN